MCARTHLRGRRIGSMRKRRTRFHGVGFGFPHFIIFTYLPFDSSQPMMDPHADPAILIEKTYFP